MHRNSVTLLVRCGFPLFLKHLLERWQVMRILRNNNIPDLGRHDVVCADYGQTNLKMGLVRIDGQDLTLSRSYLFFSNEINPHSSSSSVPAIAKKICDENKINYLNLSIASSETIYYKEGGKHSNYMKWGFSSNQNSLHDMTVLFHDFNKFAFHNDAVAMSLTSLFLFKKTPG